jgi:hypothetical protein
VATENEDTEVYDRLQFHKMYISYVPLFAAAGVASQLRHTVTDVMYRALHQ